MNSTPSHLRDLHHYRSIAEEAARRGGRVVADRYGAPAPHGEEKGLGDYVTEVDRESEDAVQTLLQERAPDVPVLAEEGGGRGGDTYWAVDPLDGTTNFLRGMPIVAVSVALVFDRRPVVGAVCGPLLGLEFSAALGLGAWAGERRLSVSRRESSRAIVATGFPFRDRSLAPRYLPVFETVFSRTEDLRRAGAAALDLAWVAAGVFDGFFELNLAVWDVAAGVLLVQEAGGVVSDWEGRDDVLSGNVLAGSPVTHRVLLEAVHGSASSTPLRPPAS